MVLKSCSDYVEALYRINVTNTTNIHCPRAVTQLNVNVSGFANLKFSEILGLSILCLCARMFLILDS